MEAWARESWNSRGAEAAVVVEMSELISGGGVWLTTSSRHWGVRAVDVEGSSEMVKGPVGVAIVGVTWSLGDGATDWKAWIGRASKNSCAKMKGLLVGSGKLGFVRRWKRGRCWWLAILPFGTILMSSHQITGMSEYMLVLRKPISISSIGAFPHRSCFWESRRAGLASTR